MADTPEQEQSKSENKAENTTEPKTETTAETTSVLPVVESPPISPAVSEPALVKTPEPVAEVRPAEPETPASSPDIAAKIIQFVPRVQLSSRQKRRALFAASVVLAATLGATFGAVIGGASQPKPTEVVRVDDSQATQQTIAHLTKELATLKTSVESANKSAHAQFAKISDKLAERLAHDNDEITGSISAPPTVTPLPQPKPRMALESRAPAVVADWTIRTVRDGYVYVQGHGDIYQVSIGALLPGLGAVEQVKRQDGRWMVVTPRGIIVSQRDRAYFD